MMAYSLQGLFFFFQAEDGIRAHCVTGVQTCALPIAAGRRAYEERDPETSAGLLRRAAALIPSDARERLELAPVLAHALAWSDEREAAEKVLDEAEVAASNDEHMRARILVTRCNLELWGAAEGDVERMLEKVRKA